MNRYQVKVIHVYEIVAQDEEDAVDKVIDKPYSESIDCQFESDIIEYNVEEEMY